MVAAASWECLAGRARSGDQAAVNALLRSLQPYLHKLARTLTGPDEDDLAQVALLAVWRGLEKYDPARPFKAWARVVAKRAMLSLIRAYRSEGAFADGYGFGVADRPPVESVAAGLPPWWVWEVMAGVDDRGRAEVGERFGLVGSGGRTVTQVARLEERPRPKVSADLSDTLAAMRVAFEVRYGGMAS